MRTWAWAWAGVAATAAACTCATPPAPFLSSVDPAAAPAGADTALSIRGGGFFAVVRADLDRPDGSTVRADFSAELSNGTVRVPLAAVTLLSESALSATLRSGAAVPGTYDLAVADPRGRSARLARAVLVTCAPDGAACDDGDACTRTDQCASGICVGGNRVVCPPPPACHAIGACDPATGACSAPAAVADGTGCDDGDACTSPDACRSGACTGPLVCQTASNTPPLACLTVSPVAGIGAAAGATQFTLDARCSTDAEDPGALLFRFAFDYGSGVTTWEPATPSPNGTATVTYLSPGIRTVAVEVTDLGTPQGSAHALRAYAYRTLVAAAPGDLVVVSTAVDESDPGASPSAPGGTGLSLREAVTWVNGPPARPDKVIAFGPDLPPSVVVNSPPLPAVSAPRTVVAGRPGVTLDFNRANKPCLVLDGDGQAVVGLALVGCDAAAMDLMPGRTGQRILDCTLAGPGASFANAKSVGVLVENGGTVGPRNDISGFHDPVRTTAALATVEGNRIRDNVAGIVVAGPGVAVRSNVVHGNAGRGLEVGPGSSVSTVWHNTFAGNGGDGMYASGAVLDVRDDLFTSNGGVGLNAPSCTFVAGGLGPNGYFGNAGGAVAGSAAPVGPGDVPDDPLYVSPSAADYRLRGTSRAIDAGVDVGLDVNGPSPGNWDGAAPDLGAYEYPGFRIVAP